MCQTYSIARIAHKDQLTEKVNIAIYRTINLRIRVLARALTSATIRMYTGMRRLAPMGAITLLVFIGALAPLSAHADIGQSVADAVTDPLIGADWSQGLGVGLSGTLTQATFPVRFTRSPYYGPKFFFGLDVCDDAQYQQCHSSLTWGYNSSSISPNGTPDVPTDATLTFSIPEGYQFDANKYYLLHVGITPNNGGGSLQVYGSAADTLPGESTNAPNMSDLAFTLTGISYTGTTTPPAPPSGIVLNHAVGGNVIHAPNYVSGGIPDGIGIPYNQLDSVPGGDYWVVVFFAQSAGCPSSNYVMNMFQPGAYWGYDSLPDGFHKAFSTAGGGCMQQFRIRPEGQRSPSWYFGALSNTGMEDGLGDANGIQAFAVCYDQASCDAVQRPSVTPPAMTSNVLFLPGIEGSRLYNGTDKKLWEPSSDTDVQGLSLTNAGASLDSSIHTKEDGGIIEKVTIGPLELADVYSSFLSDLGTYCAAQHITCKNIPYDWRLSLNELTSNGKLTAGNLSYTSATSSPYILQTLKNLASSSPTGKVTIIAHSNGGLVAKKLFSVLGPTETARLIDKVVFVAVPQSGAPASVGQILVGYDASIPNQFPLKIVNASTVRSFGLNSPMAYHLTPSAKYFQDVQDPNHPVISFTGSHVFLKEIAAYGNTVDSANELGNYIVGADGGRITPAVTDLDNPAIGNPSLETYTQAIHNELDSWTPPAGVQLYQIAGWGVNTLAGIDFYEQKKFLSSGYSLKYRPDFIEDGDGTVPVPSALMVPSAENVKRYWVNLFNLRADTHTLKDHGTILSVASVRGFVLNNILGSSQTPQPYVSETAPPPNNASKSLNFFVHSPVSLEVFDSQNNRVGLRADGTTDNGIDGAVYGEFGEVKYISVPAGNLYHLKLDGKDRGVFSLDVVESLGSTVIATTTFADIPTTNDTVAELTITNGVNDISPLAVDVDGNGVTDYNIHPLVNGVVSVPSVPPEIFISFDKTIQKVGAATIEASGTSTALALVNGASSLQLSGSNSRTVKLQFTKNIQRAGESVLNINAISYDGGVASSTDTMLRYYWLPAASGANPALFLGYIKTKAESVLVLYRSATNKTIVMSANTADATTDLPTLAATLLLKPRPTIKQYSGFGIPGLVSQMGVLKISY